MMTRIWTLLILCFAAMTAKGQSIELIKMEGLQKVISGNSAPQIQVVNFWATWCAPCIKELPLFERLNESREDVTVSLVSVDMDLDPDTDKVYRFVARKKLKSNVYILDEEDPNTWIDKIDKNWSGAIPATLIINPANGKRKFVEKELKDGDLDALIASVQ